MGVQVESCLHEGGYVIFLDITQRHLLFAVSQHKGLFSLQFEN